MNQFTDAFASGLVAAVFVLALGWIVHLFL
jgi:hypothetical protein